MNITLDNAEFGFCNHDWKIRAIVTPAATHGYLVLVSRIEGKEEFPPVGEPHNCATLREAVTKAMDIVGC